MSQHGTQTHKLTLQKKNISNPDTTKINQRRNLMLDSIFYGMHFLPIRFNKLLKTTINKWLLGQIVLNVWRQFLIVNLYGNIMCTTFNIVVCFQKIHIYLIQWARHVSGITFIKYAQITKSNNIKVFGSNKTRGNRQNGQFKSNG
jgi:hypothetical protein